MKIKLLCLGLLEIAAMPAMTSGGVCTQYSQCNGQNWNGCTTCPGDQECIPKGGGTLTSLCRDPESRCSIDFCGVTCSGPEADSMRLFNRTCAEEQAVTNVAVQTIPNFCQNTVRKFMQSQTAKPNTRRCHLPWLTCEWIFACLSVRS